MAYSTEQRDALREAIASGALRVKYDGKEVEYRSLEDMRRTLALIEDDLLSATRPRRSRSLLVVTSKGL